MQIDEIMKEAIQRDCTRYAPGIEIIGVRVTKPKIPPSIARNYEIMEEERTKVAILTFFANHSEVIPSFNWLNILGRSNVCFPRRSN